jgi:uncharacterized protein YdhG (YjbR/CyaY superfamily)
MKPMAGKLPQSVDAYIDAQPEPVRVTLGQVRSAIRKALPDADETVSYGMPTYKMAGKTVLNFAAWKEHYSLYAATERVVAKFGKELQPYTIDKGTIRFPLSQPVPAKLIADIAKFRAGELSTPEARTGK